MNKVEAVRVLGLPDGTFVVVGSSTMVVLGLAKDDDDVDVTVTPEIFANFEQAGWKHELYGTEPVLKNGIYDVGTRFYKWDVRELLSDALVVDGVPFISLQKLLEWKRHKMRPVDIPHIALIENYLAEHRP